MTDSGRNAELPRRAFLAGALGAAAAACTPAPPAPSSTPSLATSSRPPTPTANATESSPGPSGSTPNVVTASPSPTPSATPASIADLAGSIGGRLVLPGGSGYPAAARLFNPRFDGAKPVAIAYCTSADDVRRCVDAARTAGVTPIARSGGHSYAGYSTGAGLVIDVTGVKAVTVAGSEVTIGGGARLIDVYDALAPRSLGIPAGSCPTVGVAGLTLGGGLGIEARQYGLTADQLLAVDVVLASGDLVTATPHDHADLYWACRGGGGGNFGIVTRFLFSAHRTSDFTRWQLRWPWARAADVLQGWSSWVAGTPRELFSAINCSSTVTKPTPSVSVFGVLDGSPAQAAQLMAELTRAVGAPATSSFRRTATHAATVRQLAGCAELSDEQCGAYAGPGAGIPRQAYAGGSDLLRAPFTPAGAAAVVAVIDDRQRRRLATGTVLIDSLGGAIDDVSPSATAYVHRGAFASMQYLANWDEGARASTIARNLDWFAATKAALAPHASGEAYQNYLDADRTDWRSAYYGANYRRLMTVKSVYDPSRLFTFPQAIGA